MAPIPWTGQAFPTSDSGFLLPGLPGDSYSWASGIAGLLPAIFVIIYVSQTLRNSTEQRGGLAAISLWLQTAVIVGLSAAFPFSCFAAGAEGASSNILGNELRSGAVRSPGPRLLWLQLHFALLALVLTLWSARRPQPWFFGLESHAAHELHDQVSRETCVQGDPLVLPRCPPTEASSSWRGGRSTGLDRVEPLLTHNQQGSAFEQ